MLTIRLTRIGKKKQPLYRFIVSEKARDPWGKALEILGSHNTLVSPSVSTINEERVKYWISKGAQCSDTVWNLFVDKKIVEGDKRKKQSVSNRRREKLDKKKK